MCAKSPTPMNGSAMNVIEAVPVECWPVRRVPPIVDRLGFDACGAKPLGAGHGTDHHNDDASKCQGHPAENSVFVAGRSSFPKVV